MLDLTKNARLCKNPITTQIDLDGRTAENPLESDDDGSDPVALWAAVGVAVAGLVGVLVLVL
jgi:hypothetical protein